jgi:hypothetical protein
MSVSVGMFLVINIGFDLNESPVFKRVSEGAKSTASSCKNSSTEARLGPHGCHWMHWMRNNEALTMQVSD